VQRAEERSETEGDHHRADATVGTRDQVRQRIAAVVIAVLAGFGGRQGRGLGVGRRDEVERRRPCFGILGGIGVIGEARRERLVADVSGHDGAVTDHDHFTPTDAATEIRVVEIDGASAFDRLDRSHPVADDPKGRQAAVTVLAQRGRGEAVECKRGAVHQELDLGRQGRAVRVGVGLDGVAVGPRRRLGEAQDVIEFDLVGGHAYRGVAIDGERSELVGEGRRRVQHHDQRRHERQQCAAPEAPWPRRRPVTRW
jgi:hypothetical protein